MAAEIALHFKRVLFMAHRVEITTQARAELGAHVHVMSIHAALHYGPEAVDLLIIDEAHRTTAATYRAIIAKYKGCAVLGLTATPRRTDGQGLVDVFDEIVECSSVKELIESGHLVPYRALEAPDAALKSLASMKRKRGDYDQSALSELMSRPRLIGDVVREYRKHGLGRRAVAFCVSVEHSKALAAALVAAGVRAKHLDGTASEKARKAALKALSGHEIDVLCNVNLFTEGWDCPSVSCVIMARPTESLTLYLQSVGRGMRPASGMIGKTNLLILDHAGNMARHGYPDDPREWSLESEAQRAKREKEVAELERLLALGFDSIEAELEEKDRARKKTYSAGETIAALGIPRHQLQWLRGKHNLTRLGTRYLKSEVDALASGELERKSGKYTAEQTRNLLNISDQGLPRFLKRRGVIPTYIGSNATLYDASDIDRLLEQIGRTYSAAEAYLIIGGSKSHLSQVLKSNNVRSIWNGTAVRYLKSDIDGLAAEPKN